MIDYYFAAGTRKFLKEQEPVEEILRERIGYYERNQKEIDFWFVENPNFITDLQKKHVLSNIQEPMAVIISTNRVFINWIKLRIGYVFIGKFNSHDFVDINLFKNVIYQKE
uniref:Conserved hypothetical plastid protein n=1 Tax=Rhodochaete parvula TaxID=110510 RepID=A0A1X9PUM9_9RHOD|nr:conserved hypothetical plastid protein [Rhodochaete parvula]ASK39698.1 hypothetical protein Rhodc_164 [Rhodochaete parvula]